jgi:hypothetical protein
VQVWEASGDISLPVYILVPEMCTRALKNISLEDHWVTSVPHEVREPEHHDEINHNVACR